MRLDPARKDATRTLAAQTARAVADGLATPLMAAGTAGVALAQDVYATHHRRPVFSALSVPIMLASVPVAAAGEMIQGAGNRLAVLIAARTTTNATDS